MTFRRNREWVYRALEMGVFMPGEGLNPFFFFLFFFGPGIPKYWDYFDERGKGQPWEPPGGKPG